MAQSEIVLPPKHYCMLCDGEIAIDWIYQEQEFFSGGISNCTQCGEAYIHSWSAERMEAFAPTFFKLIDDHYADHDFVHLRYAFQSLTARR